MELSNPIQKLILLADKCKALSNKVTETLCMVCLRPHHVYAVNHKNANIKKPEVQKLISNSRMCVCMTNK